jgi:predicted ArsR family transcriptional regulator
MLQQAIPEDIRRFVLTSIPSVPHLEALLLLRADAQQPWRTDVLAQRLYIRDKVAQALLEDLCTAGMAAPCAMQQGVPAYRYRPACAEMRQRIDRLADLYAKHLVEMTHLIHSKLDRKAQQFADAFKWRKD